MGYHRWSIPIKSITQVSKFVIRCYYLHGLNLINVNYNFFFWLNCFSSHVLDEYDSSSFLKNLCHANFSKQIRKSEPSDMFYPQDGCIVCPTTDSTFDLRTGAIKEWYPKNPVLRVLTPALRTLFVYPVKTDDENIYISIRGGSRSDASAEIVFSGKAQPGITATDVNVDEVTKKCHCKFCNQEFRQLKRQKGF